MQKFRGLDPSTRPARWGLLAVTLAIVFLSSAPRAAEQIAAALSNAHDTVPWYLSRLLAFLAYLALACSVGYGLLLSTGILDAIAHRPITFSLHQDLASVGLGLAAVHAALLGLDRVVPFTPAELIVPFASRFQPLWVGFGQVGLYVSAVVVGSFYVRRRIGQRAWRTLHYLSFLAFVSTTAHGILSGTDSGTIWAWWIYAGAATTVTFLMAYRIVLAVAKRRGLTGRQAASVRAGPGRPIAPGLRSPDQEAGPG